jgi:putative membrane protein
MKHGTTLTAICAASALCLSPVVAQELGPQAFLLAAMQRDVAAIELGRLAAQHARSEEVRELGHRLVADHRASFEQAAELARAQDIPVPSLPTPEADQALQHLAHLSGAEFDRAFIRHVIEGHQRHIEVSEQQVRAAGSAAAALAETTLPVLAEHLEAAESVATSLQASDAG